MLALTQAKGRVRLRHALLILFNSELTGISQCEKCNQNGTDCVLINADGACQRCRDKKVKCSLFTAAKTRKISVQVRTAQSKGKQRERDSPSEKKAEASGLAPLPKVTLSTLPRLSIDLPSASITPPDLPATAVLPELFEEFGPRSQSPSIYAPAHTAPLRPAAAAHAPRRNYASGSRQRLSRFGTPSNTPPSTSPSLKAGDDTHSRITALEEGVSSLWVQVLAMREWITDIDSQVKLANSLRRSA
jgi:hypothetical protein